MRILTSFIIFIISFSIFNWIIKKLKLSEKTVNKAIKIRYNNFLFVCIFFLFMFFLEYSKYSLYELYGRENWISIAFAGILGSIYINFVQYIFKKR